MELIHKFEMATSNNEKLKLELSDKQFDLVYILRIYMKKEYYKQEKLRKEMKIKEENEASLTRNMLSYRENINHLEQVNADLESELVNRNKDMNQIKHQYQDEINNLQDLLAMEQHETKRKYY